MKNSRETIFTRFADWISEAMGTPANIGLWVIIVGAWIALFAFNVLGPDSNILPSWFTSNAFNFPLNTVTTLAELYIGFFIAAAANRVERSNRMLHEQMKETLEHVKSLVEKEEKELKKIVKKKK